MITLPHATGGIGGAVGGFLGSPFYLVSEVRG
jgi:hypothetical protein